MRLHPIGKHALSDDEKFGSNIVGGLLLVCILGFLGYFALGAEIGFRIGLVCGGLLIPAGGAFSVPERTSARKGLVGFFIALAVLGCVWIAFEEMFWAAGLLALGIFAYGWVANYFIGKASREF